ncbi:glycosyltransferase family 39 protein [Nonomuraea monospora]|uniref:Glycosyltransferase family 39 protein n=1 Tax=Nonomuraea monospora TaxID=568818 RepID=A0ABN3CI69_9ACTN
MSRWVLAAGAMVTAFLLLTDFRHGYLRDELYFRLLRDHLSWGYYDQPPLVPWLARISTAVFGDTLWALRMPSALAIGVFTVLAGLVARELGGGRGAQVLAAVAAGTAPWPLGNGDMLVTNAFDLPMWLAAILFAVRALRGGDGRWWVAAGLVCGLATYNKYLIGLLGLGLLAGLLVAGPRRALAGRWLWAGVAVAVLVAAPNLVYQVVNGFPQLTMADALAADRGAGFRVFFVPMQLIMIGPLLAPLWVAGWVWLAREPRLRAFAVAYPVCGVAVLLGGGRPDYIAGLVMLLLAAGCVAAGRLLTRVRWRVAAGAVVAVNALFALAVAVPVLPLRTVLASPIPRLNLKVTDSIGWPELARQVAGVYHGLPDDEHAIVLTGNYGEAGALHRHGLRAVYSGHNELHRLGPPPESATVAVVVGGAGVPVKTAFRRCVVAGRVDNGVGLRNAEQGRPILLCRDRTDSWARLWPRFLHSHHYG